MRTVFLSSTAKDLAPYREAAYRAIEGLDEFHCVRMEDFGARADRADKFCREKIAACDVAVFLVGLCRGSSPKGSGESYTEGEYAAAGDAGLPRLVFLSEEDHAYPGCNQEAGEARASQAAFRRRVSSDTICAAFTTPEDLATKVSQTLANWARENQELEIRAAPRLSATLCGGGAIAQQDAVAAGAMGIAIGGSVTGDVIAHGGMKEVHYHYDTLAGSNLAVVELVSKAAAAELEPILRRRVLEPERSREEIRGLLGRFEGDGELHLARIEVRNDVLHWAARLHATQTATLSEAIGYRDHIRQLSPTADTRIVDAWILATQGDIDAALQIVRDLDTPDGRSNLFALLRNARGGEAALAWFLGQPARDDPAFLTGVGWHNVAVSLAMSGQLQEAVKYLAAARNHVDECPALALNEGTLNAVMLLPAPVWADALKTVPYLMEVATVEGEEADRHREQALVCFDSAVQHLGRLKMSKQVQHARLMHLWLRLTDHRQEVAKEARRDVSERSRDGKQAVQLLPLVRWFDTSFDFAPASQYLESRKRFGGLGQEETIAEFMLALKTLSPGEFAGLIEREEQRFAAVFPCSYLTSRRIEALAQDGQITRATALLENHENDFSETEAKHLRTLVNAHAGMDVRAQAEDLYRCSSSWLALKNLIGVLERSCDWSAARPLLEKAFQLQWTLENAEGLVRCLQYMATAEDLAIVEFLDKNSDLVARSHNLASAQAWSLFHLGRWQKADTINRRLIQERTAISDLLLDTNLALQTGDWERFAVIVDREWKRRGEHTPDALLRLATLAAEFDVKEKRAMELAKLATEGAPDDPHILINALSLAFQLGREDEVDPSWLAHAVTHSKDTGPAWRVDLKKMVEEMIPAHRERAQKVERALIRGEIPLHFAATALNVPLSNILLDLPRRNAAELDGRLRTVIPTFSGARNPTNVQAEWTVGFDVTAILVLFHLGLLRQALDTVYRAALTPDTMLFLLTERRKARFHQPSRVKKAEEVRSQLDRGRLRIAEAPNEPPRWLLEEVGRDFAQLLETAKSSSGRVVHPLPIHKVRSFQKEEADLREYSALVLTTVTFARLLHERGWVDAETHGRSRGYLLMNDQDDERVIGTAALDHPIYLDNLALTYLQDSGLLGPTCRAGLDLRVHAATHAEQGALIEANREGERLAASLDTVRHTLRDALTSRKAFFLPHRHPGAEDERKENWLKAPSLATFLEDVAPCDAVCFDDRFLNSNPHLTDRKGRVVPVLCTLDILRFLETQRVITATERDEKLHRLREGCFGLVPVSSAELEERLLAAHFDAADCLQESPELRAIRQTMMRLRSLDMVQQPQETPYLDKLRMACVQVLLRLWRHDELSPSQAVVLSDWIWRHVSPSPLDWNRTARGKPGLRPLAEAFGNHIAFLLQVGMVATGTHQDAFREWVERAVLAPLLPVNSKLLDGSLPLLEDAITRCANGV